MLRVKDIKSLLWLCRWYNGRSQRLEELHQNHLATLSSLVLDELGGIPTDPVELTLCGFVVRVAPTQIGMALVSIAPPLFFAGEQLALFTDDELAAAYLHSQSHMEVAA